MQKDRSDALRQKIPVLGLNEDKPPLVVAPLKYLVLDHSEITNVPFRKLIEGYMLHLGIHVMDIIPEAAPDTNEGIGTRNRDNLSTDEEFRHFVTLAVGRQTVALKYEAEYTLCDGLRDHDSTYEIPVPIEVEALRGRSSEVMVGNDALVTYFEMAIDALLKRVLELGSN
jgi:hypothetical protein